MSMSTPALPAPSPQSDASCDEAFPVTLGELIAVLAEVTDNDHELVATAMYMIEGGRVRLVDRRAR